MKLIKQLCFVFLFAASAGAYANSGGYALDKAPDLSNDRVALQHGAKLFVNYCLNCHAAASMRYNRLKDIGLTDEQIKENLLFSAEKVGETMKVSLLAKDAKEWFGATPPDLSVIARAKAGNGGTGADYLYTYLRTFYRDNSRPTGWNNLVFPSVGMPHVLWDRQPTRALEVTEIAAEKNKEGKTEWVKKSHTFGVNGYKQESEPEVLTSYAGHGEAVFKLVTTDVKAQQAYDNDVASLVAFMQYMADPTAQARKSLGLWVLLFLTVLIGLTYLLNKEYWKDIK